MDHENTCRADMLCQKICASRKRKANCLIFCHYLMIEKQASGQEREIGERSSCRILFILLSPSLSREVLSWYQKSEQNNYLLFSLFPVSTFKSSIVSPDWEIPIGSAVPLMGRKIATFLSRGMATPQAHRLVMLGAALWHSRINVENDGMVPFRARLISQQKA